MPKKITLTVEAECDNSVSEEMLIRKLNLALNKARVSPSSDYIYVGTELVKLGFLDWTEVSKRIK